MVNNESSSFDVVSDLPVDLTAQTRTKLFVLQNCWRTTKENQKVIDRIPSTFGDVELVNRCEGYTSAKTVVFLPCSDMTVDHSMFRVLKYFFDRDGAEALVFEYNPFENTFQARTLDDLCKRVA